MQGRPVARRDSFIDDGERVLAVVATKTESYRALDLLRGCLHNGPHGASPTAAHGSMSCP